MIEERLEQDLKTALLAGDKLQVSVLRSLKSAITYAEVAKGIKGSGQLSDDELLQVLAKQAKQRQESADAYTKAGSTERADAELAEKAVIDRYLPKALTRHEIEALVSQAIYELGAPTPQTMGRIIGEVKQKAGAGVDGALIAQIVKERLER
jgi:uncharacterized protein